MEEVVVAAVAAAEYWRLPTAAEEEDRAAIIGRRVLVEGHGVGKIVEFVKQKGRASAHIIRLDASGETAKIKLARKGNGKTPWQIWDSDAEAAAKTRRQTLHLPNVAPARQPEPEAEAGPAARR